MPFPVCTAKHALRGASSPRRELDRRGHVGCTCYAVAEGKTCRGRYASSERTSVKPASLWSRARGSHTKWRHPLVPGSISVSGADGADAKDYQEADIHVWIARAQEAEKRQRP